MRAQVPPLPADEWQDAHYEAYGRLLGVPGADVPRAGSGRRYDPLKFDVVGVMVRSPGLAAHFLGFNAYLQRASALPLRAREVCILRVAGRRRCAYMWAEHVAMALEAGLTEQQVAALVEEAPTAEGADALIVRATDELLAGRPLPAALWEGLVDEFGLEAAMDFLFLAGSYQMLAAAFDTWGLQPAPDAAVLPDA